MFRRRISRRLSRFPAGRSGFTVTEMLIVVVVIGIMATISIPKISSLTARNKASEATDMIQRDLERAFAIAARLRKPVQIVADNSLRIYRVIDASGGTVRISRRLDGAGEFGVQTMTFSPSTVTVQPTGVASDTLGVTLTSMGTTRKISMTRVGLVRRSQ